MLSRSSVIFFFKRQCFLWDLNCYLNDRKVVIAGQVKKDQRFHLNVVRYCRAIMTLIRKKGVSQSFCIWEKILD